MSLLTSPHTTRDQLRFIGKLEREYNRRSFPNCTTTSIQLTIARHRVLFSRSMTILIDRRSSSERPCMPSFKNYRQ